MAFFHAFLNEFLIGLFIFTLAHLLARLCSQTAARPPY